MNYVYDIETYRNFFCAVFRTGDKFKVFEISTRRDDSYKLRKFLNNSNINYLIGFNNVRFDMQVLELFLNNPSDFNGLRGSEKANVLYDYAQDVIERSNNKEFPHYPEYKLSIKQIDLFLINHYNNRAKSTSLKWLEFMMNWEKVQDLPLKFDSIVTANHFDEIIEYCKNDVSATYKFAKECNKIVKLRLNQHQEYPTLNLRNKSDSSVGEILFLDAMSKALDIPKKQLKIQQTHHNEIRLEDCMLPYINFKTKEFQKVHEYMKGITIRAFEKQSFGYTINYKGIDYVFGEGGLHASCSDEMFEIDKDEEIEDADVTSYYPNLAIKNKYYPAHLSEVFCDVYEGIFNKRQKIPKSDPRNYSYKIILNGAYGKSKDKYSFLYDTKFQLQITINGQLLLAMLAERLSFIPSVKIIQVNTDGITFKFNKKYRKDVDIIYKKWQKLTKLNLEFASYKKMIISDVNNYLAVYENGKIKAKGRYEIDVDWHKNKSQRIVPIALKRYFVDGVPVLDTIKNHCNVKGYDWDEDEKKWKIKSHGIYDFCIGKKITSNQNYKLVSIKGDVDITDKVIRYYISNSKQRMMKCYSDGRREAVNKGYDVQMFMDYEEKENYNINYMYYVNECNKIITDIMGGNDQVGFMQELNFNLTED